MILKEQKAIAILRRQYHRINNLRHKLQYSLLRFKNKLIIRKNLKNNFFAIEINNNMGMGAKLVWVLEILAFCDEKNLNPIFKFTHPEDKQKEDTFGYYFEIRNQSKKSIGLQFAKMKSFTDLNLNFQWNYHGKLNLEFADQLIKKYLLIKPNILDEVNQFESTYFKSKTILGVHYRGTDKKSETNIISYQKVERNIALYIEKHPVTNCIFVSSDDNNFIDYIVKSSITCPIIYNNDSFRSSNNLPVHLAQNNLYEINKDAIINCLLLSKCTTLMKTASILSDWSKLFNPNLQLILLSKPYEKYKFFPGKEYYNSVLYDPVE